MNKPILLTGAAGNLGRVLTKGLAEHGFDLRLTDVRPFPDTLPSGAVFEQADLEDGVALLRLAEGCGTILHFGGVSTERPFEQIIGPNLRGLFHIYEAARRERARVVFASSNHAIGFHERPTEDSGLLDVADPFRPDGYYGLSKAYGELMGRMYWDKHGVENVNLRIGACYARPADRRQLSIWLSFPDLVRLATCCIEAERVAHAVVWGVSQNPASYWGNDHRERIGWEPQDSAEPFRAEVQHILDDAVSERYQGGTFAAAGYSRTEPAPRETFALD
ncbi:NAD-dependent epimerase/dehydratase family protein [Plastoroseomonas arctica]|uniref:NAD(P)-dependent oxidoreductase n=1 Tax=Plastoroseomonas arctica TaxID=1509237 RepID=A0AAF1JXE8_9PROT|nr:NAD(P)-dependent oxidoreductase [Plastoroseomonas arctica]MBR0654338.1 NAD(P)-dependent oxidoreductase [Plastoroseomonas arctica]